MKQIDFLKNNLIAHRGVYNLKIPENSILSFTKAIDKNYIIELDIHILSDDSIVVFHDYNLNRLLSVNKIIETLSYAQLSKYKLDKKYLIPTLEQVIHIVNGKVPLLIEVKCVDKNIKFMEKLVELLDNYDGEFAIQSSNTFVIEWLNKNRKNYVIGLIVFNKINLKLINRYLKKINFLTASKRILPLKSKKMVLGWTIRTKEELEKYRDKCDNLICENIL